MNIAKFSSEIITHSTYNIQEKVQKIEQQHLSPH